MKALYGSKKAQGQPENRASTMGMKRSSGHPEKISHEMKEAASGSISVGSTRGTEGIRFKMQGANEGDYSKVRSTIGKE